MGFDVLCGVLLAANIAQAIMHYIERGKLTDRIMSRNLTEFKGDKLICAPSAHDEAIRRWRGGEKR